MPATRRRRAILPLAILATLALAACLFAAVRLWAHRGLRRRLAEAAEAVEGLADPLVRRDLKAHAAYLDARLGRLRLRDVLLGRLDDEVIRVHQASLGRIAAPHLQPGHHVLVTVSALDGAELPTSVAVPEGWDGQTPLPLVLDLHAAGVREMADCFPVRPYPGVLCITPLARGSHDYRGPQMTAVEECLADVRRRYPVSTLLVTGASMGGTGAWLFAQRHAGELSGLAPWMGNADPDAWKGLWEDDERSVLSPAGRACELAQRGRMPVARVGQLAGRPDLPIYIGHGVADTIVPVAHGDSMAAKLKALGAGNLRYDRFDGVGHGGFPVTRDERIAWLLANPPAEPGELVAVIPPLTFVADMAGAPPHRVMDPLQEARLLIRDGQFAGGQNVVAEHTDRGPSKWRYPGPAGFAFENPFRIVVPEDAPDHLAACAAQFAATWKERWGGTGIFPVTPTAAARPHTVIALGSPAENPAVRAALDGLNIAVAPGSARLFGRQFTGDDIGLILLLPNALDPSAATLVVWGSTPESYRQLWGRFGHVVHLEGDRGRWYFDYAVFDRKTSGPDSFLAIGWFDHEWRFDPQLLFEGSAELRAAIPGGHWATEPSRDGRLWLSTLPPDRLESRRGPLAFDRSAGVDAGPLVIQGQRFERGIGMIPPATAAWSLHGRFARFRARVGLERTGMKYPLRYANERVRFEVWADGACVAASPVLSATDGLFELTADIRGAGQIELRAVNATKFVWHFGPVGWGEAELTTP
ncbi:MAG TPA: NPCBM/NEW2 domain-containing protein [Planctomycetota bacterium]|nr:NPCBM/NEW2 domain-containing protein [Planctomycetota bacterium]